MLGLVNIHAVLGAHQGTKFWPTVFPLRDTCRTCPRSTLPGPMQSTEVSNGHQVLATLVVIPGSAGETWNSHSRMKSCHNHIPECGLTCCLQTQCKCLSLPLMAASHFSCGRNIWFLINIGRAMISQHAA